MHAHGKTVFRDAQELHRRYPESFQVPSAGRLDHVAPGSLVKVCAALGDQDDDAAGERFWVEVLDRHGDQLVGRVDNQLRFTADHGLALNDRIEFSLDNIYDVYDDPDPAESLT
jgi:hypothetical protein